MNVPKEYGNRSSSDSTGSNILEVLRKRALNLSSNDGEDNAWGCSPWSDEIIFSPEECLSR
jgi:hypothetical protein